MPRLASGCLLGAGALAAMATTRPPRPLLARARAGLGLPATSAARAAKQSMAVSGTGAPPSDEQTRLDELGRLALAGSARQVPAWRAALHAGRVAAPRSAWLHLWLGEVAMGRDGQPEEAIAQFRQAERLSVPREAAHGLAAYDTAIALYELRAYQESADAFHGLLTWQKAVGFDRRRCALWYRQAGVCAGYHAANARLGIPEPERLDPLCGAASLAACLRALGLPSDKASVLRVCRVTELGSNGQDLRDACRKLGLSGHAFTADDLALQRLRTPLIVHVEHDHFVALTRADREGVSYLCSHCGPWPGGRIEGTWKQWQAMNPGACFAVSRRGSKTDRVLTAALAPGAMPAGVRLAAAGSLTGMHLAGALQWNSLLALLKGHVMLLPNAGQAYCGMKRLSPVQLPMFPKATDQGCGNASGPLGADPVNLATGEEQYAALPDLTVYNPTGPPVVWQRIYNSLRSPNPDPTTNTYQYL